MDRRPIMVFKKNVVETRLAFLRSTLAKLKELQKVSRDEFLEKTETQWAVEHGLHLAAEAIFDIGNHILVGYFSERAVPYDLVLETLAHKCVVSEELVQQFERLGGFRNILVHEYLSVDLAKVYERLQNGLTDLERFITEICEWLQRR
jgi:uncharacterized protein YutE (UPF0331/DUF86 family)